MPDHRPSLALELICTGESIKTDKACELGIVFNAVPSELLAEEAQRLLAWSANRGTGRTLAEQAAAGRAERGAGVVHVRRGPGPGAGQDQGQLPAPLAAVDAIEKGCNKPLDEGLKVETEDFVPLVGSTISRNLIAIFFMTQRLQKDPGVAEPHRCTGQRQTRRRARRRHHGGGHRRGPCCAAACRR